MRKNRLIYHSVYAVYFFLFIYIFWKVPYCHDEWAWGLPDRIDMMKKGFEGYNGRYLGNLLAIVITRSVWAKTLLLAVIMLGLLLIMVKIASTDESKSEFWTTISIIFFLLAVPRTLFQQTYGWVAAFVNFVPPVLIFLLYYAVAKPFESGESGDTRLADVIWTGLLCVAGQLFSEHNTIFHVLFAMAVLVYGILKYRRIKWQDVFFLLAFSAGAALMFMNSAYGNAANNVDGYKHIQISLVTMVKCYVDRISDSLLLNNWILNVCIAGIVIGLIMSKEKNRKIAAELIFVLAGYAAFGIWYKICPDWRFLGNEFYDDCMRAGLGILFVLHVLVSVFRYTEGEERRKILIWYVSAMIVAGPLLMANPIGARCFYVSYIFQVLAIMELLKCRMALHAHCYDISEISLVVLAGCMVLTFAYGWMFREIGRYNDLRTRIIKDARKTEQKEIALPLLPYSDYCWTTEPPTETWEKRFKKFYHLSQDVKIQFYDIGF